MLWLARTEGRTGTVVAVIAARTFLGGRAREILGRYVLPGIAGKQIAGDHGEGDRKRLILRRIGIIYTARNYICALQTGDPV